MITPNKKEHLKGHSFIALKIYLRKNNRFPTPQNGKSPSSDSSFADGCENGSWTGGATGVDISIGA